MTIVTQPRAGGHRGSRKRPRWGGLLVIALVIGLVAGAAVVLLDVLRDDDESSASGTDVQSRSQTTDCGEQRFSIAADPRIATTVREIVETFTDSEGGACITVGVRSVASARTAADVARAEGKGLGGSLPDAWIPDSSLWLEVAGRTDEGKERLDGSGTSLATTPVVLATTRDRATAIGWPDAPDWSEALETNGPVTLAVPRLDRDAPGLASLGALQGSRSLPEFARLVAAPPLPEGQPISLVVAGAAEMVPSTEQEVAAATDAGADVVAIYDESFNALNFPLVRVQPLGAEENPDLDALFAKLRDALTKDAGQKVLGAAGFRAPDGTASDDALRTDGVDYSAAAGEPASTTEQIDTARSDWATQGRRARMLLLMDRSGSMGERLPDGQTRAEAAQPALRALAAGASPDDALGLWAFTTGIGNGDYEILLSARRLDLQEDGVGRRAQFLGQVDELTPVVGGATPLYDTIAAAYENATQRYVDGRFNAVVVVTDGRNEDAGSLGLPQLLDQIRRKFDGARPVRIITVAYGEDADVATLRRIADATGGRSYRALTAEQVQSRLGELFSEL